MDRGCSADGTGVIAAADHGVSVVRCGQRGGPAVGLITAWPIELGRVATPAERAALSTLWRTIDRLGLTVKKTVHADEQRRPDIAAARRHWRHWQPLRDVRRYVFLDECGVTTDLLRRYGRSPRGTRLHDHTSCGALADPQVVAALRLEGLTAPAVFDGPIDNPTFLAYVDQVLVPTQRRGDVVVLDNLAVHKQPAIRAAIEAAGASLRFLRPTARTSIRSTQAFAKLKASMRARGRGERELLVVVVVDPALESVSAGLKRPVLRRAAG